MAGKDYEDKRPLERYVAEARRLLGVLEQRLDKSEWLAGEAYSIADMATFPWVRNLIGLPLRRSGEPNHCGAVRHEPQPDGPGNAAVPRRQRADR